MTRTAERTTGIDEVAGVLMQADPDPGHAAALAEAAGLTEAELTDLRMAADRLKRALPVAAKLKAATAAHEKATAARDRFWDGSLLAKIEAEQEQLDKLNEAATEASRAAGEADSEAGAVAGILAGHPEFQAHVGNLSADITQRVERIGRKRAYETAQRRERAAAEALASARAALGRFVADYRGVQFDTPTEAAGFEGHKATLERHVKEAEGRHVEAQKVVQRAAKVL